MDFFLLELWTGFAQWRGFMSGSGPAVYRGTNKFCQRIDTSASLSLCLMELSQVG